jgi:hypothetical protein
VLRTAWLVSKATDTDSDYVVLIALRLEQWAHNRVSLLRYAYIDCLVQKQLRCLRQPTLILPNAQKLVVVQLTKISLHLMEPECPVPRSNESVILRQLYPVHVIRPHYSEVQKWHLHFCSFRKHAKLS